MTINFQIEKLPIAGLILLQRKLIEDRRGYIERLYCEEAFQNIGFKKKIIQINHTLTTKKGTVRGMHFQHPPHCEIKIVSCIKGEVYDVAIDLRSHSPTFLQWHAELLSETNRKSLLIPEGFAHGFQTMSDNCELLYFHTAAYTPQAEGGICPIDSRLNITWPLTILELSTRDLNHPRISLDFQGIKL